MNQAVEAAKRGGLMRQSGFVNACLRRFLRERDALVAQTDSDPLARWNHPQWWLERLQKTIRRTGSAFCRPITPRPP